MHNELNDDAAQLCTCQKLSQICPENSAFEHSMNLGGFWKTACEVCSEKELYRAQLRPRSIDLDVRCEFLCRSHGRAFLGPSRAWASCFAGGRVGGTGHAGPASYELTAISVVAVRARDYFLLPMGAVPIITNISRFHFAFAFVWFSVRVWRIDDLRHPPIRFG